MDMEGFPTAAPRRPSKKLRYADVAVTATAKEFSGHYRGKQYHPSDFRQTLSRALTAGVTKVMLTGMSLADVSTNFEIARSWQGGNDDGGDPTAIPGSPCWVTIGVHPYHATEPRATAGGGAEVYFAELAASVRAALAEQPCRLAAFGELSLDYDRLQHADKDVQLATFRAQLALFVAEGWDLPLFLHCRAAFDDFVAVVTPYLDRLPRRGLVHSFVGTRAQMEALVALGFDISVNGFSFQDRESLDMVAAIPLDRLQIETDAPWGEIKGTSEVAKRYLVNAPPLPANKKRDKWDPTCMVKERNESCAIERVAYVVAGLKGISVEEVAEAAYTNSINMFDLGER
ncbi:hypothetical protein BX600DRAFT_469412 [Xylariales sp. PMI_506]|nr:hypothetical protein BX600DRAFT_469412 [Xylariales sp. PMI_506]